MYIHGITEWKFYVSYGHSIIYKYMTVVCSCEHILGNLIPEMVKYKYI